MNVDYLRPAICDGTALRFRTEYVRRGKRFATLRTEVVRADGRVAEAATGLWSTED
jgi:acyl-coenzyme A thioesterase PaaI-like protein